MADYSGDFDPWSVQFNPDAPHYTYWWSFKDFSGSKVIVPKEYLGLLVDGVKSYIKRNRKHNAERWEEYGYPHPRIHYNSEKKQYWMKGGIYLPEREVPDWLERNGFEAKRCKHNNFIEVGGGNNIIYRCHDCHKFYNAGTGVWF